jgi:hypothetical protein
MNRRATQEDVVHVFKRRYFIMKWEEFLANEAQKQEQAEQRHVEMLSNAQAALDNSAKAYLKCLKVLVDNINNDNIPRDVLKLMAKQMSSTLSLDEIK